jgi:hypothetical protein
MRVSFPAPSWILLPVFVVTGVLAALVGAWALLFVGVVLGIAHVRNWSKTHEARAQRVADGAHLLGVAIGVVLVLALEPAGLWLPVALLGPAFAASSLAGMYTTLSRRTALAAGTTAAFEHPAGGGH